MTELNSQNFISSLKPFIILTRVIGLMPISLKNQKPTSSVTLKLYNVAIIVSLTALFAYSIYSRCQITESQKFYYFNDFFLIIFGYFLLLSAVGIPIIRTDLTVNTILKLEEVDTQLKNVQGVVDYRRSLKYYAINMCFCLLMSITVVSCDSTSNEHKEVTLIPFNIFLYVIYVYAFVNLLEFNCFVYLLTQRIEIINEVLKDHIGQLKTLKFVPKEIAWSFDLPGKFGSEMPDVVEVIQDVHFKLIEISRLINSIFSAQILITSILTLVELTVNLYCLILRTLELEKKDEATFDVQRPIIWFIFNVLLTLSFVLPCVRAMSKGSETPELIHKFILKTNNTALQNKLSLFSLQLLHHNIVFTAAGFFSLNMTLIVSITAAVTSYLVILVQFAIAS